MITLSDLSIAMQNPYLRDPVAAVLGLMVGSFLNVLGLRSIEEKSIISPPSHCPKCKHRLAFLDLIPVLSYFMLGGKCRYCSKTIAWYYPFVEFFTAVTFVVMVHTFTEPVQLIGMTIFSCSLIALCLTDFKDKLLPHEITYPSIILGIIYSALARRNGVQDAMIGVGCCYILFDFLAFYGLKWYMYTHRDEEEEKTIVSDPDREGIVFGGGTQPFSKERRSQSQDSSAGGAASVANKSVANNVAGQGSKSESSAAPNERAEYDDEIDGTFGFTDPEDEEEDFEVMGGGDTVLAALIAAWLGWQALFPALIVGFMAGTVLGASYLSYELHKAGTLRSCLRPSLIGAAIGVIAFEGFLLAMNKFSETLGRPASPEPLHYIGYGLIGALCGGLLGVLKAGKHLSKPFPFGPALAVGAVVAMFAVRYDPNSF